MRLRQAMLSSTLQQNATLFVFFATGVVIAHLLTPRQAGSYAVAIAAVNAIADLKDSAIGSYVVSAPEVDNALMRAAFGTNLTIATCLIVGLFGLSFLLADFYQDPALGEIMRIVAVAQLGPAAAFPATMHLTRAMRFGSLLIIGLAAATCQSIASVGLAALGYGGVALAWGYFVSALVTAAMTIAYKPDAICLRPTLTGSGRLLAFGGWASATLVVGSTTTSAPELMIGRVLGLANAALFSRAQNLVSFVRNGLVLGIARPLLPGLGKREGTGANLTPIYQRIVEAITGLSWPVYAVLAIWAEPIVRAIYGEAWAAAGTMMAPIAIAHALTLTVGPHYDILIVKRRQRLLFFSELAVSGFTLMALAIGMTHGIEGTLWGLVLSGLFFAAWNFIVLKSVIALSPGALAKAWSRSLVLTLVAIPAPLAFRHFVADSPIEIVFGFATSSAISAIFWIATVVLVRHELSFHLSGLLNDILVPWRLAFAGVRPQPKETDQG